MSYHKISLIHPTSNPNVRNAALSFAEAGMLHEVITTIGYNADSQLFNSVPFLFKKKLIKIFSGRVWKISKDSTIKYHPYKELFRLMLLKTGLNNYLNINQHTLNDWIYKSLDQHASEHHLKSVNAIYAYEDGAASTFEEANKKGILCFYDLPTFFFRMVRKILEEEADIFPQFRLSLQAINQPDWKIQRKEKEIALAQHIFTASSKTKQSLLDEGIDRENISVIPYGAPVDYFYPQINLDGNFRALFVGRVGAHKGIHYLLEAWKDMKLPNSELLLIGVNEYPDGWLEKYSDLIKYIPYVPHAVLNNYYSLANVFILPSLVEGFGLVLLEAMACGVPVITTTNSAAPDFITEGVDGFIIPIRDVETLKEKIEWCYLNQKDLEQMGIAARKKAEELSWKTYRKRLSTKVKDILDINN